MAAPRTAKQVIDQAIHENRLGEWLCYGFAIMFVLVGVGAILWGAGIVTLAGSIASILFLPALHAARQIRKENMAIRLLEVPLSLAATAEAAAEMLQKHFSMVFANKKE